MERAERSAAPVLVAYASRRGATREIAARVAAVLARAGLRAELRPADEVTSAQPYRAVVLGSALHGGAWLPEALELLESLQQALARRPVWLFSSGPHRAGASPAPARLGVVRPRGSAFFSAPSDWAAVEAWAERVAQALNTGALPEEKNEEEEMTGPEKTPDPTPAPRPSSQLVAVLSEPAQVEAALVALGAEGLRPSAIEVSSGDGGLARVQASGRQGLLARLVHARLSGGEALPELGDGFAVSVTVSDPRQRARAAHILEQNGAQLRAQDEPR